MIQEMHERLKKANERRNCRADEEIIDLRAALAAKDAEIERLKAEVETLAWNLGGISTLACSRKLVEFDSAMARPALHDVAALVKDYAALANAAPDYNSMSEGDTPEAAMIAAGLMKGEEK